MDLVPFGPFGPLKDLHHRLYIFTWSLVSSCRFLIFDGFSSFRSVWIIEGPGGVIGPLQRPNDHTERHSETLKAVVAGLHLARGGGKPSRRLQPTHPNLCFSSDFGYFILKN